MDRNTFLTGSTGVLGSHVLYEWVRQSYESNQEGNLYVLVRSNDKSAQKRLEDILTNEARPRYMDLYNTYDCLDKITVIEGSLNDLTIKDLEDLKIDVVIHSAGSTNLSDTIAANREVNEHNLEGTSNLLRCLPKSVKQFVYISTAYSYGYNDNLISEGNDFWVPEFRNPYEASKFYCEQIVTAWGEENKVITQITRPSIISGRLLDDPLYVTSKFDVFYSWPLFLQKFGAAYEGSFRIWLDTDCGLNIMPVDIAAKCIMYCHANPQLSVLNIVNPKRLMHSYYVGAVLEHFGIKNYEYVSEKPTDLNRFEKLYYKTVGGLFEQYITKADLNFDPTLICTVLEELNIQTDLKMKENFMDIIEFAIEKMNEPVKII